MFCEGLEYLVNLSYSTLVLSLVIAHKIMFCEGLEYLVNLSYSTLVLSLAVTGASIKYQCICSIEIPDNIYENNKKNTIIREKLPEEDG